jgi:hypothetical protein
MDAHIQLFPTDWQFHSLQFLYGLSPISVALCYLAFGILYPSICNFGWCFFFSLLQIIKYTTFLSQCGHLHVYNLFCSLV